MFDSGGRILGHSQGRERGIREIERYCCRSRDSCGFGMRGQKSRLVLVLKVSRMDRCPFTSVSQNSEALLEGMHAGLLKFVPVNLKIIKAAGFQEGDEVSLESLKKKGIINPSGRERRLPLKFSAMKLDKRLSDLGAEAIVERGLGDDQHPSGESGILADGNEVLICGNSDTSNSQLDLSCHWRSISISFSPWDSSL